MCAKDLEIERMAFEGVSIGQNMETKLVHGEGEIQPRTQPRTPWDEPELGVAM